MESREGRKTLYTTHYQVAVGGVAVVVALVAWAIANSALAFAAAIVGLYALHLMSIRFILEAHREQQATLEGQWSFLRKLVGPAIESGLRLELPAALRAKGSPAGATKSGKARARGNAVRQAAAPVTSTTFGGGSQAATATLVRPEAKPSVSTRDSKLAAKQTESAPARAGNNVPVPRHFALGTVALVRKMLTPAEVARVLLEQRRRPDARFAALAVDIGLLTKTQREELLLAQQEGLFTDAEMREARRRLQEFRQSAVTAMSEAE